MTNTTTAMPKATPFKRGETHVLALVGPKFTALTHTDGHTSRVKTSHFTKGFVKTTVQAFKARAK
jgi:hypothetical protein